MQNIQRLKSGQQTPFVRAKLPTPVTTLPSVLHRAALVQNIQRVLGGQQVPITRAKLPTSVAPSKPSQLRTAPVPTASALTAPSKIPASARLTTAAPVITKPVITKPVITKPYAHPATPTLPHITQPIGVPARPLLPATTPQRQTAQPLGAPASPKPEKKPAEQPLTTRPVGVPTGWIPTVPAVDLNPASKPQRRGYGDPPLKPEGNNPHVQSDIERAFKKQGAKNAEQREVDYSSGRITREAALNGATGEDRAKMNDALNRIDRGKVGGSNGGSGASSGIRSSAQVKDVWQEVDKKGGIDAMPESAVRHLKGVTEQGLKNTDLTPAERGDLLRRLEETNRAQGQHHKAREATKNNPPVNPSSWNLPMGKTVFGTQAAQPHWQPSRPNSNASASANNVAPSTANNTPNTSSTVNGSETSQVQQTNAPSSVEATPAPTSVFEGRSEKNKFEILPSTLVRVASGLAVRVNDLTESQKLEHNRLTSSGLSKADINEIVNHLSVGSVDDLANKYSQLSADNLAGVSLLLYGLNGPASIHDLSHALIGDRKSMAFDASERGEASGHALLNDFITDPQGIYDGFSVGRGADQNPVVSMTPTAKQTALNEFGKARGQSTRVDKVFSLNFNGNSFKRARKALQDSAAAGLDPKVWPSRFEVFYNSLAKSGQLPKKHDAALAGKLRESFSKYEADTRTMDPAQTKETTSQAALYEIAPILMRAASREFKKIPTDQKLRFYADGIAAVLAINNASPAEVQKPTGKNDDRFNYGWVGLPTSESVAFTKPGFLKDYLEIRNQVRQMLGVPSQSARDAVK